MADRLESCLFSEVIMFWNALDLVCKEFLRLFDSDSHILNYKDLSVQRNKVNLHYYRPDLEDESNAAPANLGDELSLVIVKSLCKRFGIAFDETIDQTKHLFAVGSILLMGHQDATILGTGLPYSPYFSKGFTHRSFFRKLDIRCVRGPLTRKELLRLGHRCPKSFGDPAVLLPLIYQPRSVPLREVGFIPHYTKEEEMVAKVGDDAVISMRSVDYRHVIDQICSCKKIVSSSLHGIILAEAYGVPVVYLQDREDALCFKYEDWYLSTGRTSFTKAHSIAEALTMECEPPANIVDLQDTLLETFPKDLWMSK